MENLRYSLPLLELKAAEQAGVIEGYGSTFAGPPDLHGDQIEAGAFSESLAEHEAAGTRPAMLWGHRPDEPIGKWLDIHEDEHGLYCRGKLTLSVPRAKAAYDLARDDAIGLSIGFRATRQKPHKGANLIQAVYLGEISLVGMAANPAARITSVKSLSDLGSITEYQSFLRDCGLSVREAKALARHGWKTYRGEDLNADLAEYLRHSAQLFKE
jgi:HK97 family phage prohead protease